MAVILDANVYVSAALSSNGPSAALLRAARSGLLDVVASPLLWSEVDGVLRRPKFRRFLLLAEVDELIDELGRICRVEPDPELGPAVVRDRKDDYLVYLSRDAGAECIVSGDADLTDADLDPPAISPRQAIDRFGIAEML